MPMFVLKRVPDGYYVARPGSQSSYTRSIKAARKFDSREEAEGNRCPDNERVVDVQDELEGR